MGAGRRVFRTPALAGVRMVRWARPDGGLGVVRQLLLPHGSAGRRALLGRRRGVRRTARPAAGPPLPRTLASAARALSGVRIRRPGDAVTVPRVRRGSDEA